MLKIFLASLVLFATARAADQTAENILSTPLVARSAPGGTTLFTELPPERTGIVTTNRYDDPRMWAERHREYHVGAIGSGVAVGDYDGDGHPDIFIVSKVESGRLFRNLGNWHFEDVTDKAGVKDDSGEWKQGAAFADVNNDGLLDLYVCRFDAPNQLYINQGNGTFKEEAAARGLAVVDACNMASFVDYDRDGWLDVYIQTNLRDASASPAGQRDYLFHNNGDGTFTDVTGKAGLLPHGTQGHSATWWDFNEDGWPDLYVANDFDGPDYLYRNNQDGTFTNVIDQTVPHMPFSSMGADSADVNSDGHIDLFVGEMAGTTHEKNQRGVTDSQAQTPSDQNEKMNTAIQLHRNMLYLNTGTGRCLEGAFLAGIAQTDWTWSARFEDLDNDGRADLFITTGMDREQTNLDMIERRMAALSPYERIRVTKTSPILKQPNLAYVNRGNLQFEEVSHAWGLDQVGVSFGAAFGDFDGDGDLDLVYTNYQQGATVLRNDSQHGNSVIVALRGTASNHFGVGARVEATTKSRAQVRDLLLARGYLSTSEPVIHFGFGDEQVIERLKIIWPSGREQIFANLVTGRRYIITEPSAQAAGLPTHSAAAPVQFENVTAATGLGIIQGEEVLEGTVPQPLLSERFNRRGPGIAVGDLNGDGVDEIVVAATTRDGAKIFQRDGSGYRSLATGPLGATPPIDGGPPLIFDANGDGANDLLLTAGGAAIAAEEPEYEPKLWLNDGHGGFAPAPPDTLPSEPISVGATVAADFNHDGKLDLFLGGRVLPGYFPETPTSALLLQQNARMEDATDQFAPALRHLGHVTSALATDVDGDGWIDLVVTLEWGGVHFFRNIEGHKMIDASAEWGFVTAGSGLWTSVVAADFNHDGKLDYALGNVGLNTEYTATRGHPMRLFAGDFAHSSKAQLIVAYDDSGSLRPVASRAELSGKIPSVLKRFPSNNHYAAATLNEILGPEALAKASVHEAAELSSGVLLSQASGHFKFCPLPRPAQIAPVQGMVAADFDGDGNCDLLLAHNDYSPIPAVGRWDGGLGLLLPGDGRGNFVLVPPMESAWLVSGDAKALAMVDLDGDHRPDAIVSRNNETLLAFRNTGRDARLDVAVRLRGRGGNPAAIGARIILECDGKNLSLEEIHAGSGFASQSSATAFFSVPKESPASLKFHIRWPSGISRDVPCPSSGGLLNVDE
jgi:hypothetical protein